MKFSERIEDYVRRLAGLRPRVVKAPLLGRSVEVVRGSIRSRPDYDDAWVLECARRAKVALDAGTNTGQDALLMLVGGKLQRLIAVDANREALAICAQNLIFNGMSHKAVFVLGALSDRYGEEIEFWADGCGAASSIFGSHAKTAAARGGCQRVRTITADDLCDELGLLPDFVKVDIEGAEVRMLNGAMRLAREGSTRFLVEMHSNPELPMELNVKNLLAWCSEVDYKAWYLKAHQELRDFGQVADRGRFHVLVQPSRWPYPEWLAGIAQGSTPAVP